MRRVSNNAILPRGTELFHGSIERIEGPLRGGGDRILWFADSPKIAQLYIPRAGMSMVTGADSLRLPTLDPKVQAIQRAIGIEYDLGQVEWGAADRAMRWHLPVGWENMPTEREINERLQAMGYKPDRPSYRPVYRFHFDRDGLLPPGGLVEGELFVVAPKRDLRIADVTSLGGDLMNPAHLWLSLFRQLKDLGYDGVVINDYAQSEDWGNFGHRSLGVFPSAIRDLKVLDRVPATYEEFAFEGTGTRAWPRADETDFGELPADPADTVDWDLLERLTAV
jgi:hypothetical protein